MERIKSLKRNVVIVGELNVDLIISGEEIKPELNREKIVDGFDMVLGSSSAITACALAALGVHVIFVGVVGDDYFGEFCIDKLNNKGVDTTYIQKLSTCKTGVTLSFSTSKDRALLTYMGAIPGMLPEKLPAQLLKEADHIHFGSFYLQKGMQTYWQQLFADAQNAGVSTSFDTGWDPEEDWKVDLIGRLLKYTDLFIPSEDEFRNIFGGVSDQNIFEKLPMERKEIAVKCGDKGAILFLRNKVIREDGYSVHPIDTTGAGDSFNAGLIFAYLAGKRGTELLNFANACGALATLRVGGAEDVPDLEEVYSFMERNKPLLQ
ncbi:sugar kinase [Oceanobacillus neutriphilus]|uniref:Sugar kinase n=2 Tax=Oceanobacillus neutriphilus TaxID=531815 RepID=A0ABQ2NY08_9BACI|nr:sugar kinase [Oceanobacillus neutriphilus]